LFYVVSFRVKILSYSTKLGIESSEN